MATMRQEFQAQMAAMQAQHQQTTQAMQAAMDARAEETRQLNHRLEQRGSQALDALPALLEQLTVQARPAQRSLVDTRGIGRPQTFKDDESSFTVWRKKTEGYIVSVSPDLREPLEWAMDRAEAITYDAQDTTYGSSADEAAIDGIDDLTRQLHNLLINITDGESFDIVNATEDWNGLEAWRKLSRRWDPTTAGRKRNLLRQIINPGRCKLADLQGSLERHELLVQRYERTRGAQGNPNKVQDDLRLAALTSMVPADIERHLLMNDARLSTYELARA